MLKDMFSDKFLIYTMGRSGSTLLQELLSLLPSVDCEGELLASRIETSDPFQLLKQKSLASLSSGSSRWGFKVKTSHVQGNGLEPQAFLERLYKEGWKLIHLRRSNLLNLCLSFMYANQSGRWFSYRSKLDLLPDLRSSPKVHIDVSELMDCLSFNARLALGDLNLLSSFNHLEICYETDLLGEQMQTECILKICSFLGLPSPLSRRKIRSRMKKNIQNPSECFSNWTEVLEVVRQTEYRIYL
jgi:LPS sulfotransferase NodH